MRIGKVYFVRRRDGLIKIGFSANAASRIKALARHHGPLEIIRRINGSCAREALLHRRFAALQVYGEWFQPNEEMLSAIAALDEDFAATQPVIVCSYVREACIWAQAVIAAEFGGIGDSVSAAIERAADRHGIDRAFLWSLRYRPPKDMLMTPYMRLKAAFEALPETARTTGSVQ